MAELHSIKFADINELKQIYSLNNEKLLTSFREIHDCGFNGNKKDTSCMNNKELSCIVNLFEKLNIVSEAQKGYVLGYKSQPIMEQFDILKFVNNYVLNIELKSSLPKGGKDEIREQLIKHKRYLEINDIDTLLFTYVENENSLYKLTDDLELNSCTFESLSKIINNRFAGSYSFNEIENSEYIISPYNEIDKFLKHSYFLTEDQIKKENKILEEYDKLPVIIYGKPGSGKSLLLFDIAKKYVSKGKSVRLILGSKLNNSIKYSDLGFKIQGVAHESYLLSQEYSEEIIIIDEAQRLYDLSFKAIEKLARKHKVIISVDLNQTLHPSERSRANDLLKQLKNKVKLTKEIRYSEQLDSFIQKLIFGENNREIKLPFYEYKNVDLVYFTSETQLKDEIYKLQTQGYQPIELTPYTTKIAYRETKKSHYFDALSAHQVIGREYDKVVCILDDWVSYDKENGIEGIFRDRYPYLIKNLVFEALSRVRKKITIAIVNNPELYIKIAELLTKKKENEYKGKANGIDNKLNELSSKLNKNKEISSTLNDLVDEIERWANRNELDLEAIAYKLKKKLCDKYYNA